MTLSTFAIPHALAGTLALLLFWLAAIKKKGTTRHRRIGQAYLLCMALIVLTGIPLTLKAYLEGNHTGAVFLAYLLILVSHSCATSVRAIRLKHDRQAFLGRFHRIATGLLGLSGAAVVFIGWNTSWAMILVPFGAIGIVSVVAMVRQIRATTAPRNWWLREHYGAMIGNGIATHIAFSQIGLARLMPAQGELSSTLGWLLPLAIGLGTLAWLNRRFQAPGATIRREATLPTSNA
jgi:hypothetical protein